ncbi:pre-peptidase C-terminal domain-containing protein [Aurantiacibacter gangjinensis]|uniref:Uncharacterized protein n=1 Tax=Aurantiacibacter gangjinensis TaxID=502682 RepID=A0A0G9MR99_9SPHN|nr:pre-peptidase C-terminal domain-containing protein [Aurantiacibacter gangjinensis]APE27869.1 bacterial pre-peptidase C-terminal domain protein [Aurantiacibacter gangjinensis]KLE31838.1 hypothetical protein AAW01_10170 [Aurantiacibacter gangjinensis]
MMKRVLLGGAGVIALAAAATGLAGASENAGADAAVEFTKAETGIADKQGRKPAQSRGGPIELGQHVRGSLSGNTHTYTMEAEAGQRLRMVLTSDDFDTVLRVTGPNGFSVENDDASGAASTLNSAIDAQLPSSGTYSISVMSYGDQGSGAYQLMSMDAANPVPADYTPARIMIGQTLTGSLSTDDAPTLTGGTTDYWQFSGRAGDRVTVAIESDSIDPYLTLYLPDGRTEENDDRGGLDDLNSQLSVTLPVDGVYTIGAGSFAPGMTGDYNVIVRAADTGTRTVMPSSGAAQVYALSVGVSEYERISPLTRTDEDAMRVNAALRENGMLAPESVTLIDGDATRANFQRHLTTMTEAMGPDDTLMIFFSGHGEKVENMTTESDGSAETIELFDAALYDYELAGMLDDVDARVLLVIDACFAGGFNNVIDDRINRMGVFSSDEDTLSLVADGEKAGGYISEIFRRALEGGADMNSDRAIEAGELSEFMRREFYRMVLDEPLQTDAEDFRDHQVPGWQHIVVDRGGDGMPHQQVLMNFGSADPARIASR